MDVGRSEARLSKSATKARILWECARRIVEIPGFSSAPISAFSSFVADLDTPCPDESQEPHAPHQTGAPPYSSHPGPRRRAGLWAHSPHHPRQEEPVSSCASRPVGSGHHPRAGGTGTVSTSIRTSTGARQPGPPNRARAPASTRSGPSSRPRIEGRARRTPPRTAHADGIAITAPSGAPRVRPPRRPGGPRRRPRRHRPRRRPPARSRPRRGPRRPRRRPHRSPHRSIQPAD